MLSTFLQYFLQVNSLVHVLFVLKICEHLELPKESFEVLQLVLFQNKADLHNRVSAKEYHGLS